MALIYFAVLEIKLIHISNMGIKISITLCFVMQMGIRTNWTLIIVCLEFYFVLTDRISFTVMNIKTQFCIHLDSLAIGVSTQREIGSLCFLGKAHMNCAGEVQ